MDYYCRAIADAAEVIENPSFTRPCSYDTYFETEKSHIASTSANFIGADSSYTVFLDCGAFASELSNDSSNFLFLGKPYCNFVQDKHTVFRPYEFFGEF